MPSHLWNILLETKPKRRVLGDITNATNEDIKLDGSKKPNVFSAILPQNNESLMPIETINNDNDDEKMTTETEYGDDRFYMQRPSDDIDARDEGNPLHCTAYINQMYDIFSLIENYCHPHSDVI